MFNRYRRNQNALSPFNLLIVQVSVTDWPLAHHHKVKRMVTIALSLRRPGPPIPRILLQFLLFRRAEKLLNAPKLEGKNVVSKGSDCFPLFHPLA